MSYLDMQIEERMLQISISKNDLPLYSEILNLLYKKQEYTYSWGEKYLLDKKITKMANFIKTFQK